jgi:hypothetical protein
VNCRYYFWRTYDRQEIDFIESSPGSLNAYEIKWKYQKVRIPEAWRKTYPDAEFRCLNPGSYLDWIS